MTGGRVGDLFRIYASQFGIGAGELEPFHHDHKTHAARDVCGNSGYAVCSEWPEQVALFAEGCWPARWGKTTISATIAATRIAEA